MCSFDYPKFTLSNQKEESIGVQKVQASLEGIISGSSLGAGYDWWALIKTEPVDELLRLYSFYWKKKLLQIFLRNPEGTFSLFYIRENRIEIKTIHVVCST